MREVMIREVKVIKEVREWEKHECLHTTFIYGTQSKVILSRILTSSPCSKHCIAERLLRGCMVKCNLKLKKFSTDNYSASNLVMQSKSVME